MLKRFECLRVAEEAGHIDQKVVIERSRFRGFALQEGAVILELIDSFAAPCAAEYGARW